MSEIYQKDESIHEPSTAHLHPLETTPQGSQADSAEGQHEHRDVSFSALAKWFTGLFVGIAASFLLMWGYFNLVEATTKQHDSRPSALFVERPPVEHAWPDRPIASPLQKPGAMPILLAHPEEPMQVLRAEEDETLSSYNHARDAHGRQTGAVTIPIERAIELTVQRGLPSDNKTRLRPDAPLAPVVRPGAQR